MIDLDQILERLIQRTGDGKLKWSPTVGRDQFVTSVDTISVVVCEIVTRGNFPITSYRLDIFNEAGDTIEVLRSTNEGSKRTQRLEHLHTLARRSALDTQSTLEKLAKALEA